MASSILPPPFNLVPTASGIRDMFRWFRLLAKPSDGQRAKCSLTHCCYIVRIYLLLSRFKFHY